jgi:hypothetical protein
MCVSQRELDTARQDVEYYRDEAEQLRDRERERQEEQRRQAQESMQRRTPSNRLFNGEVTDFADAVRCHIAACEAEMTTLRPDEGEEMRKTIESCNQTMREAITRANQARQIYDRITAETETRIVEALQAAGLTEFADCLESGDYSPMAI